MKKKPRGPKPLPPVLASATGPSLIKHLASCNTTVRSQALRLVQSWLVSQTHQLSDPDIRKLWKGLFYCLWHADKTPNQVALIDRLTTLFLSLQPSLSLEFFRGFLVTLRREWPGIDRLRLDKFYLLIRGFMRALFERMRSKKWDLDVLREYFAVLEKDSLLAEDKLQGNGVNYHLVSVFLDELKCVGFQVRKEVVHVIFGPFFEVMKKGKDQVLLGKVKSCLFDELLRMGKEVLTKKKMGEDFDDKDGNMLLGLIALKMGFCGWFYEVGSSTDCIKGNRKVALGLHEDFLVLDKDLELSGVEIDIPEYTDEDGRDGDHEVPQLIPIDSDALKGNVEMKTDAVLEEIGKKNKKKVKKGIDGDAKKKKKKMRKIDAKVPKNSTVKENIDSASIDVGENLRFDTESGIDVMVEEISKKNKQKAKKEIDGDEKKKKKKIRKVGSEVLENSTVGENNDSATIDVGENFRLDTDSGIGIMDAMEIDGSAPALDETVILNLQKQFEKVAAEMDSSFDEDSGFSVTPLIRVKGSKRKRTKSLETQESSNPKTSANGANETDAAGMSVEKSSKKVSFALKKNLVWKPQNPLPPESLRLPPSVTPRGSALKKGVPPGPIIETPSVSKKTKKKKIQNRAKSVTPMMRRRIKVQVQSA